MRAITLWQPWASLWCSPAKLHETRRFSTPVRGWIAVHAGKHRAELSADLYRVTLEAFGGTNLPRGCIVGAIELLDCQRVNDCTNLSETDRIAGDWRPGRHAWRRGGFVALEDPIEYRGAQGWFGVPDYLLRRFLPAGAIIAT